MNAVVPEADGYLERIRAAEIESVRRWFQPGNRVLEIGGMNGYQASVLASWGCAVRSIDIEPSGDHRYFEVERYDGTHLPVATASMDRVFSSNVLEHVRDLPALLAEIGRVLRPDGLAIHLMPTAAWRFWSSLAHYGYLAQWLLGRSRPLGGTARPELGDFVKRKGKAWLIKRALWAGAHGEYPNALSELYYFSHFRWVRTLGAAGFSVVDYRPGGLLYTGYSLLPGTFDTNVRAALASALGSASHVFVLKMARPTGPTKASSALRSD